MIDVFAPVRADWEELERQEPRAPRSPETPSEDGLGHMMWLAHSHAGFLVYALLACPIVACACALWVWPASVDASAGTLIAFFVVVPPLLVGAGGAYMRRPVKAVFPAAVGAAVISAALFIAVVVVALLSLPDDYLN